MAPPPPLDAWLVAVIWERMGPKERQLTEELLRSGKFIKHCAHYGIGPTKGALFSFVSWDSVESYSVYETRGLLEFGATAAEYEAQRRASEAAEASHPVLRLRAVVKRVIGELDVEREAAALAMLARERTSVSRKEEPREKEPPKDGPRKNAPNKAELAEAVAQFQRTNPQAGYWEIVKAVAEENKATQRDVRAAMPGRPEKRPPGRPRKRDGQR
jgi:hypothetical protein